MVQMSGGSYEMDYDQEFAYFSAKCLAQDVVDIFGMETSQVFEIEIQ